MSCYLGLLRERGSRSCSENWTPWELWRSPVQTTETTDTEPIINNLAHFWIKMFRPTYIFYVFVNSKTTLRTTNTFFYRRVINKKRSAGITNDKAKICFAKYFKKLEKPKKNWKKNSCNFSLFFYLGWLLVIGGEVTPGGGDEAAAPGPGQRVVQPLLHQQTQLQPINQSVDK